MYGLIKLEIFKLGRQFKTYLALFALNTLPLIALVVSLFAIIRLQKFGFEAAIPFEGLSEVYKFLLIAHLKALNWILPFFLVLILADMISGEMGKGTLKTLCLRPVARWQILFAKIFTVMAFLMACVAFGGLILQINLILLKFFILKPEINPDLITGSNLIPSGALLKLLGVSFVVNLSVVGFTAMISVLTHRPTLAMAISLILLLVLYIWAFIDPFIAKLFKNYSILGNYFEVSQYFFTYSIERLTDMDFLNGIILDQPSEIKFLPHLRFLLLNIFIFMGLTFGIFQRKDILG